MYEPLAASLLCHVESLTTQKTMVKLVPSHSRVLQDFRTTTRKLRLCCNMIRSRLGLPMTRKVQALYSHSDCTGKTERRRDRLNTLLQQIILIFELERDDEARLNENGTKQLELFYKKMDVWLES